MGKIKINNPSTHKGTIFEVDGAKKRRSKINDNKEEKKEFNYPIDHLDENFGTQYGHNSFYIYYYNSVIAQKTHKGVGGVKKYMIDKSISLKEAKRIAEEKAEENGYAISERIRCSNNYNHYWTHPVILRQNWVFMFKNRRKSFNISSMFMEEIYYCPHGKKVIEKCFICGKLEEERLNDFVRKELGV